MNEQNLEHTVLAASDEAAGAVAQTTETVTTAENKAEAHSGGLTIQPAVIAFQALNFIILLVLLHKILYKPIIALLNTREKRIKDGVENAQKADLMLKESNQIRQDMIKNAHLESQGILDSARKNANEVKDSIITEAHAEACNIIKSGHTLIAMEKEQAAGELKINAVDLIIRAAEKVLRQKMDAATDAKLIEESLKTL